MKVLLLTTTILCSFFAISQSVNNQKHFSLNTGTDRDLETNKRPSDQNVFNKSLFEPNCATDFYTVNTNGEIQSWSLNNGTITGGNIVLSNSGDGIAYCGNALSPTFYSTSYPNTGISYYDEVAGWIDYSSSVEFSNIGGHEYNIFLYGLSNGSNQLIYHFDGVNYTLIEDVTPSFLSTYDVAVDDLGQAWIFKGSNGTTTTSLNTYDANGLVATYPINFNSEGTYGSFYLNNTLYIAFAPTSNGAFSEAIVPVIISGSTATLGTPIPFTYENYADMASCQVASQTASISESAPAEFSVYPNPSNGLINFNFNNPKALQSITIFDNAGRTIYSSSDLNDASNYVVDLSDHQAGIYHYSIQLSETVISGKIAIK